MSLESELDNTDILKAELVVRQIKHNPAEIVAIVQLSDGQIIFLEKGNLTSGLKHILERHQEDFQNRGIAEDEIVSLIFQALQEDRLLGTQGKSRKIYEVYFKEQSQYLSIDIGTNGYIVSANPSPKKLVKRLKEEQT
ncbi:hypothetical protein [Chroococcus sp. FPU101]|uniref:hypothetical protein n=1 Tax=Chroococcus sp. FPU101 TaxID=1974212 RepID=UPI001A8DAA21|nr:hypothetical protein [Chroococcus sp. FPU101]